jgi:hypothetical protein
MSRRLYTSYSSNQIRTQPRRQSVCPPILAAELPHPPIVLKDTKITELETLLNVYVKTLCLFSKLVSKELFFDVKDPLIVPEVPDLDAYLSTNLSSDEKYMEFRRKIMNGLVCEINKINAVLGV